MKKRLRKKLHKGEFQELGFEINLKLHQHLTDDELKPWLDEFIDAVEEIGLAVGGGGLYEQSFFADKLSGPGPVTPEQRERLSQWIGQNSKVASFELGPLQDAWYP